eukprot:5319952-Prymnesium_polylepis.1
MRLAVLNPGQDTEVRNGFVVGVGARSWGMHGGVRSGPGCVWRATRVCKVAGGPSRTPATCQGREVPQTDHDPPPQRGETVIFCLALWCLGTSGFRGFSRGAPVAVGFFGIFFSSQAFIRF